MADLEPAAKTNLDFILERLEHNIRSFQSSADRYRRVYFYTSMATVVFSGLISVIAGWKPELWVRIRTENLILVLATLITILSGWGMFFSPKESWLIYASSLNRLRALKTKIDFLKTSADLIKGQDAESSELYKEYQAIFDDHNKSWLQLRTASLQNRQKPQTETGAG